MSLHTMITACLGDRDPLVLARADAACWASWLHPIEGASAVGVDPGYDDDFQRMREEVNKLSAADTDHVIRLAEKLLKQTCKDVRVATYYLWARLHREGEAGLADGLNLLAALVESYGEDLLPARPNSRKLAMEWLASSKVLDSLSRHTEGSRSDAERIVASLAWLEHGLQGLPADRRPDLGALHSTLSARVARLQPSASVEQTSRGAASDGAHPHVVSTPTVIRSAREVLDSGKALASYLREQPQGWLAGHRLMKSLRWDMIHLPPPVDASSYTRLAPPRHEYRAQLKRLHLQQHWDELFDQVDRIFAEGVNHFWLDLQWFLVEALDRQTAPYEGWADIVRQDLSLFLDRLPGLESLSWNDGSPFADEVTRAWIAQEVRGRHGRLDPVPSPTATTHKVEILSLESEALALAASDGLESALAWLAGHPDVRTGREHWLSRLSMARVAERAGKNELALHLLSDLEVAARRHSLCDWEPELQVEVTVRLIKLLQVKAQRSAADRPQLNQRMESLCAALAALDPVRAAQVGG